jgi:filamentous hemagglutinin family protein
MKKLRKISKDYCFRQIVACWLIFCMLVVMPARVAMAVENPLPDALPDITDVISQTGIDSIVTDLPNLKTDITQTASEAIINWNNFDIGSNSEVEFFQPSADAAVLNRIMTETPEMTGIMGTLTANGGVYIVNPAGIVFGGGSTVNVGQLVAPSLAIEDGDLLDGMPYTFTGGADAGNVTNNGTITADVIALAGKHVYNTGTLSAEDGVVIMAAGDSILVSEPGGNIAIEVAIPDGALTSDYTVNHDGGMIQSQHVIMAAGDIWSSAYVNADGDGSASVKMDALGDVRIEDEIDIYADAGSDALAVLDIDAGDDVFIDEMVTVEAYGNGVDDATAIITVDAGGDVDISETGGDEIGLNALANYGYDNSADITINAGEDVEVLASYHSDATIDAVAEYAENSNTANVTINAGLSDEVTGDVIVKADYHSYADIDAEAGDDDEYNEANVKITTDGDVKVIAYSDYDSAHIEAEASYGFDGTATVEINAGDDVDVSAEGYESEAFIGAMVDDTENNSTATITINAGSDVTVEATYEYANADIIAEADDGINNTASVGVTAGGSVEVEADGYDTYAGIEAEIDSDSPEDGVVITNVASVTINAGGNVLARADDGGEVDIDTESDDGTTNTATTTIVAGGYVWVDADDPDSDAAIEAEATDGAINTANVNITTTGEYDSEHERDGDVVVTADEGGEAEIMAYADPEVELPTSTNTANVVINSFDDVEVAANNCPDPEEPGEWDAAIAAWTTDGQINTSSIDIDAGGDVIVKGYGSMSSAAIDAAAWNPEIYLGDGDVMDGFVNTAMVDIVAESVLVRSDHGGASMISAYAMNGINLSGYVNDGRDVIIPADITLGSIENNSDIVITTNNGEDGETIEEDIYVADEGDVLVLDFGGGDIGGSGIDAEAFNVIGYGNDYDVDLTIQGPIVNSADILINAADDVTVLANSARTYGDAEIDSEAFNEVYDKYWSINLIEEGPIVNSAGVDVTAGDDVSVIAECGDPRTEAALGAHAWNSLEARLPEIFPDVKTNTATVLIDAGGDVIVRGDWGSAGIEAGTEFAVDNTSLVDIDAVGGIYVSDKGDNAGEHKYSGIRAVANTAVTSNTADVKIDAYEVEVFAEQGGNAIIAAEARNAYMEGSANTANVLICVDDGVVVDSYWASADITAEAENAYSNTATLGIGALGESGVLVRAVGDSSSFIQSLAHDAYSNTSETIVCSAGDVIVLDEGGMQATTAGILSEAMGGVTNDAYVGVCAAGDVIVVAGLSLEDLESEEMPEFGTGGHALIKATASTYSDNVRLVSLDTSDYNEDSTANAETVVISSGGGVAVMDFVGEFGSVDETAKIEAEAYGAYVNTASVGVSAGGTLSLEDEAGVIVGSMGDYSDAWIHSFAHDGYENIANTVVCTPSNVAVLAEGYRSLAKIKSCAENGEINIATTQVYASDVYVDVPGLYWGNGIWAYVPDVDSKPHVPAEFWMTMYDGDYGTGEFVWIEEEDEGDSVATLIVMDFSNAQDCPDCPGCPCGEPIDLLAPVAPLADFVLPRIEGCPALTQAAAAELGITEETLQVAIGNALALNPNIQPCQACANLINAAVVLRDEGGSRMAAMVQTFNTLAPADAPYSPEMATTLTVALGEAAEGTQYATATEYIDAFVQYVAALDSGLGLPVGDSVAYTMGKYGAGVTDNANSNMAAFVGARLETGETF